MGEQLLEWAAHPKTSLTVAAGTTTTGLSEYFQWIPSDIGRLAALSGFILTCVIIWVHIKSSRLASEKAERDKILAGLEAEQKELATEKLRVELGELKRKVASNDNK
jgi:hypothetical protein